MIFFVTNTDEGYIPACLSSTEQSVVPRANYFPGYRQASTEAFPEPADSPFRQIPGNIKCVNLPHAEISL